MQTTLGLFTGESSLGEVPPIIRGIKDWAALLLGSKAPQQPPSPLPPALVSWLIPLFKFPPASEYVLPGDAQDFDQPPPMDAPVHLHAPLNPPTSPLGE